MRRRLVRDLFESNSALDAAGVRDVGPIDLVDRIGITRLEIRVIVTELALGRDTPQYLATEFDVVGVSIVGSLLGRERDSWLENSPARSGARTIRKRCDRFSGRRLQGRSCQ